MGPQLPYLARSLLVGGGVGEGEAENSPGCSGMSASMGGVGGCTLGGVDKDLRVDDDPLRDTQEVSITLTPMLQWDRDAQPIKSKGVFVCVVQGSGFHTQNTSTGGKRDRLFISAFKKRPTPDEQVGSLGFTHKIPSMQQHTFSCKMMVNN